MFKTYLVRFFIRLFQDIYQAEKKRHDDAIRKSDT